MLKKTLTIIAVTLAIVGIFTMFQKKSEHVGISLHQYNDLPYALCAASGTKPTNDHIWINGVKFRLGLSECPIITTGALFANLDLTKGKLTPDNTLATVWSLFGLPDSFPQKQVNGTWVFGPAVHRNFKTMPTRGGGSSNQWSFPCVVQPRLVTATNGQTFRIALCKGPMMENINNDPIKYGSHVWTEAPAGIPNPIVAQITTIISGLR